MLVISADGLSVEWASPQEAADTPTKTLFGQRRRFQTPASCPAKRSDVDLVGSRARQLRLLTSGFRVFKQAGIRSTLIAKLSVEPEVQVSPHLPIPLIAWVSVDHDSTHSEAHRRAFQRADSWSMARL